jgi:hypothetical protein
VIRQPLAENPERRLVAEGASIDRDAGHLRRLLPS